MRSEALNIARRSWLPALVTGVFLLGGCTERSITGTNPASAPGQGAATVEVDLPADSIPTWRDTTFTGFANPDQATFDLVARTDSFRSRALGRLDSLPDSVDLNSARWAVDSFRNVEIQVIPDTVDLVIPAGGATLQVWALGQPYDPASATWQEAAVGQPWDSGGGSLDALLASGPVTPPTAADTAGAADTLHLKLSVRGDSLLKAWRASNGEPGYALVLTGTGARVRILSVFFRAKVHVVRADSSEDYNQLFVPSGRTFIDDPPPPPVGTELRLGGLPASRAYMEFTPPDSAGGLRLRGAQISRAELVFWPLAPPPLARRMEVPVLGQLTGLGADFFQLGAKTPVSGILGLSSLPGLSVFPDSLAAERPLVVDVTGAIQAWANFPADSTPPLLRLGLRLNPDGQAVGYWNFGSAESPLARQPMLRMLVTPQVDFKVP